jgi:hypothetical protein
MLPYEKDPIWMNSKKDIRTTDRHGQVLHIPNVYRCHFYHFRYWHLLFGPWGPTCWISYDQPHAMRFLLPSCDEVLRKLKENVIWHHKVLCSRYGTEWNNTGKRVPCSRARDAMTSMEFTSRRSLTDSFISRNFKGMRNPKLYGKRKLHLVWRKTEVLPLTHPIAIASHWHPITLVLRPTTTSASKRLTVFIQPRKERRVEHKGKLEEKEGLKVHRNWKNSSVSGHWLLKKQQLIVDSTPGGFQPNDRTKNTTTSAMRLAFMSLGGSVHSVVVT